MPLPRFNERMRTAIKYNNNKFIVVSLRWYYPDQVVHHALQRESRVCSQFPAIFLRNNTPNELVDLIFERTDYCINIRMKDEL